MHKNAIIAVKLAGSAWLLYSTYVTALISTIGITERAYAATIVVVAMALLWLLGAVFFWRSQSLHWFSVTTVVLSVGISLLLIFGWVR
ncbi:MAG: hypothetical protein Q7J29_11755 [Stagnimonas sp.]|nr:hypothetical protein [Stagnimonas sp.]